MEIIRTENLNFAYNNKKTILQNINITLQKGDFVLLCGASGCGKTTFLRLLKKDISPKGILAGNIFFEGKKIEDLSENESVKKIGFVMQNPETQIVTDKVWNELSFGLSNMGYSFEYAKRRVAEVSDFLGISELYQRDINTLSGGEKQLINLASVLTMSPELLILDEPTSMLDPINASNFFSTLSKINTELGTTIILSEHRLEEIFPIVDKVAIMENGTITAFDTPQNIANNYNGDVNSFPSAVKIFKKYALNNSCPISVKDGRQFLWGMLKNMDKKDIVANEELNIMEEKNCLQAKGNLPNNNDKKMSKNVDFLTLSDISFRYERKGKDIIKNANLRIKENEILTIMGSNGVGKTTTLKLICGIKKGYSGKVLLQGKDITKLDNPFFENFSMLPQDPTLLFVKDKVFDDLTDMCKVLGYSEENGKSKIAEVAKKLDIDNILDSHPLDLSGGEQQKCALAKALLSLPRILLLDEPTKCLDANQKYKLKILLKDLQKEGTTIVIVSHDIEFCATIADRCTMLFDGDFLTPLPPMTFFADNTFYTTAAARIAKGIFDNVVTVDDFLGRLKGVMYEKE